MPFHATPEDPAPEPIAFGQRMQLLRTRRGMSREVLAGLLGKSTSWVKQIENGRLKTPKLETILAVAEALRRAGEPGFQSGKESGPRLGHKSWPSIVSARAARSFTATIEPIAASPEKRTGAQCSLRPKP